MSSNININSTSIDEIYTKVVSLINMPTLRKKLEMASVDLDGLALLIKVAIGREPSDSEIRGVLDRLVKDGIAIVFTRESTIHVGFVYGRKILEETEITIGEEEEVEVGEEEEEEIEEEELEEEEMGEAE